MTEKDSDITKTTAQSFSTSNIVCTVSHTQTLSSTKPGDKNITIYNGVYLLLCILLGGTSGIPCLEQSSSNLPCIP